MSDGCLTYSELAERWKVSVRHLRRLVAQGKLKVRRVGHRTVRIDERDAARFWDEAGEAAAPPPPRVSPLRPLSANPVEHEILMRRRQKKSAGR